MVGSGSGASGEEEEEIAEVFKNGFLLGTPFPKVVAFGFVLVGCSTQSSGDGRGGVELL